MSQKDLPRFISQLEKSRSNALKKSILRTPAARTFSLFLNLRSVFHSLVGHFFGESKQFRGIGQSVEKTARNPAQTNQSADKSTGQHRAGLVLAAAIERMDTVRFQIIGRTCR